MPKTAQSSPKFPKTTYASVAYKKQGPTTNGGRTS